MQTLTEKRVYGDRDGARTCLVASETGLVAVRVTGTAAGEFSLVDRRAARDVAVGAVEGAADAARIVVAVATDADVLVGSLPVPPESGGEERPAAAVEPDALASGLEPTDFGPAVGVDVGPETVVAASPTGTVRTLDAAAGGRPSDSTWAAIDDAGVTPAESSGSSPSVRSIAVPLVATDGGVFRIADGALRAAGLSDVRDVDATETPLAGTASGLYSLGNGWQSLVDDPIDAVAATPADPTGDRPSIYAVSGSALLAVDLDSSVRGTDRASIAERGPTRASIAAADEPLVDLTIGADGIVYAVSTAGTFLAIGPDEGRRRALGLREPAAIAFVGADRSL